MNQKIIEKRRLIGFRREAIEAISRHREATGINETQAVNELVITGTGRFSRAAEQWFADKMRETGQTRDQVIEALIQDAMRVGEKTKSFDFPGFQLARAVA